MEDRCYIAIDLKSFYASVECMERGLNPLSTYLVVADPTRTEKTICLAVSPALKVYGVPGRARLFEVVQRVDEINAGRQRNAPGNTFSGTTWDADELAKHPELSLEYIVAPPQMARYMEISSWVYEIYLRYVAPEDIHVYSIDEVFIDATRYLTTTGMTAREFAMKMIGEVYAETRMTATAGIGTNLFLCKVAMDIVAKHIPEDENGVRIAELDEQSYRQTLWSHRPLTDFWRVGRGYAKKLEEHGLFTMGDIARCSVGEPDAYYNEELLYRLFGINAELLIDHAWGWEPCTIADIKAYRPESNSLGAGQVLQYPYPYPQARLVAREMADQLSLELVDKELVTDQIVLTVGYDTESLSENNGSYRGPITTDYYGRKVPKQAHGSVRLEIPCASTKEIVRAVTELFDRIVDPKLMVRRMYVTAEHIIPECSLEQDTVYEQTNLFAAVSENDEQRAIQAETREKEKRKQKAVLEIQKRYGKNAILKGMNFEEGATTIERNGRIGGHKA